MTAHDDRLTTVRLAGRARGPTAYRIPPPPHLERERTQTMPEHQNATTARSLLGGAERLRGLSDLLRAQLADPKTYPPREIGVTLGALFVTAQQISSGSAKLADGLTGECLAAFGRNAGIALRTERAYCSDALVSLIARAQQMARRLGEAQSMRGDEHPEEIDEKLTDALGIAAEIAEEVEGATGERA